MPNLELLPETKEMLGDIVLETEDGKYDWLEPALAPNPRCISGKGRVTELAQEYLNKAGLPMTFYTQQLKFAATLAKVLPAHRGLELVDRLLRLFEKWTGQGLDSYHMQQLTIHVWYRLKLGDAAFLLKR